MPSSLVLSDDHKANFLDYSLKNIVHPFVHEHFSRDEIITYLSEEIDNDIRKGTDDELASGFWDHCPVEAATAEDYKLRYLEIEPGFEVLAGIRFRGLDLERPFVAILHRTRSFESEAHLREIMSVLQKEFAIFAPKAVLFYHSSHIEGFYLHDSDKDKRILMGALRDIASVPVIADIAIEQAAELDFYDRYRNEYEIVSNLSLDHLRAETAEPEEDLERYVKNDLTYKVFIGGKFAGVFIVTKSSFLGASGYYVIENLLFEQFRGKKLGPSMQSVVAKELLSLGGKVLFGSIYPTNFPSYNAALASKRVDIGGNYMVPIG